MTYKQGSKDEPVVRDSALQNLKNECRLYIIYKIPVNTFDTGKSTACMYFVFAFASLVETPITITTNNH